MDRFESLIAALRKLATDPQFEEYKRLLVAERAIKDYVHFYQGTDRKSVLERLREAARSKAAKRPSESDFWISVEDIASQLSKR
jgi:hypothetical protein